MSKMYSRVTPIVYSFVVMFPSYTQKKKNPLRVLSGTFSYCERGSTQKPE